MHRTLPFQIAILCVSTCLWQPLALRAASMITTNNEQAGYSWTDSDTTYGAAWRTNGSGTAVGTPAAGNTYEAVSNGKTLFSSFTLVRNPVNNGKTNGYPITFGGDSLKLDTNTMLWLCDLKGNGSTNKVTPLLNFPGVSGNPGLILDGGVINIQDGSASNVLTGTNASGIFTIQGVIQVASQSYLNMGSSGLLAVSATTTNAVVAAAQLTGTGNLVLFQLNTNAPQVISGTNNTFSGQWIVKAGWLQGLTPGSLGTNSITVDTNYSMPANFSGLTACTNPAVVDFRYAITNYGTLTLTNGGKISLHTNATFAKILIEGTTLSPGTNNYATLAATYPNNFLPGGSGSLIVAAVPPSITAQPLSQTNSSGLAAQFTVTAVGSSLSYQWQAGSSGVYTNLTNGGNISGSTTATLTLSNLTTANAADYVVVITNSAGSVTSSVATLTVTTRPPPSITTQPHSQTNYAGQTATLTVSATGYPALIYQWQAGTGGIFTNLTDGGGISGSTTNTLTLASLALSNAADYQVVITNSVGSVTSLVATLKVYPAGITTQPLGQTKYVGQTATFTVSALSGLSLSYQWLAGSSGVYSNLVNGNGVTGSTTTNLTLSNLALANAADYIVVITNTAGSITSSVATLIVQPAGLPTTITMSAQESINEDWNTGKWWSDGNPASVSQYSNPGSTYEVLAGARLRTPVTTPAIFPGAILQVDGDGNWVNNPPAGNLTIGEIRFKNPTPGNVFFTNLVMNGGQLDSTAAGLVISGKMTVLTNTPIYSDGGSDVGPEIAACLAGAGNIEYHAYTNSLFAPANKNALNISGATNTYTGTWNVVMGVLLGTGANALGTNSITVGTNGALETTYNINNPNSSLTLNGCMYLHQDDIFCSVTVGSSNLAAGTYTFTALNSAYPSNFPASWTAQTGSSFSTGSGSLTVGTTTTTTLTSSGNPSTYGNSVTFTATVAGATPTGTITFKDGTAALATNSLIAGQATLSLTSLSAAASPHVITAVYSGDAGNNGSASSALTQTVNPEPLTITGLTAQNKVFDGTTTAMITGTQMLSGIVGTSVVSLFGTATGTFADAAVGTAKPVTVAGLALTGADVGNYTLSLPTLNADITVFGWTAGGSWSWNINDATGTAGGNPGWDLTTIASDPNFQASPGSPFTIRLVSTLTNGASGLAAHFDNKTSYSWPLVTNASGNAANNFNPSNFILDGSQFQNFLGGGTLSLTNSTDSNSLNVVFTPHSCAAGETTNGWAVVAGNIQLSYTNAYGMKTVQGQQMTNCTVTATAYGPGFESGTNAGLVTMTNALALPEGTTNLVLVASKIDSGISATVNALVTDECGANGLSFDPVFTTLQVGASGGIRQVFTGIMSVESFVQVCNGAPGLKYMHIIINGQTFMVDNLLDNEVVGVDVSATMNPGSDNVIVLEGYGHAEASAIVTISDVISDVVSKDQATLGSQLPTLGNMESETTLEAPMVTVTREAGAVVISWSDTLGDGYELQGRESLAPEALWQTISTTPAQANGRYTVTLSADTTLEMFRIYKQ